MQSNPLKLKIAYLYPDILEGFCDESNVDVFYKRAKARDINVSIHKITSHAKIQSSRYDFYYIGGSNTDYLEIALESLNENKNELLTAASSGVPMLAVNCGYQLFGNSYQFHNKAKGQGLALLNVDSIVSKKHFYGYIYGTCAFLKNKIIAGFENHNTATYLKQNTTPFLTLKKGKGNNLQSKTEGARNRNVIGTYISSPILAQNPHFCDFLISCALRIKYRYKIPLMPLCDDIEWYSHNYMLEMK